MPTLQTKSGFVNSGNARLYYETAGQGVPFVMVHAGVADSRQWNNEFAFFAQNYQVVRYDMRGYGKSEPVEALGIMRSGKGQGPTGDGEDMMGANAGSETS